jgi:hypothetical protein
MCKTYSRPAFLIAAIASVTLSGALIAAPVAKQPTLGSTDQLQHSVAAKKTLKPSSTSQGLQLRCPAFTARCKSGCHPVCLQKDSRGCCKKSTCVGHCQ